MWGERPGNKYLTNRPGATESLGKEFLHCCEKHIYIALLPLRYVQQRLWQQQASNQQARPTYVAPLLVLQSWTGRSGAAHLTTGAR
jgi:hypothetical protein